PLHHDADTLLWHIGIQPAWSPDVLWLNENTLVARCVFPPHQVPLSCRLAAQGAGDKDWQGRCWRPQTDHNVRGFALASGGRRYSWGYGVQAAAQLAFPIPSLAEAFRTEVGLDHLAGDGGCVRARILVEQDERQQLWASPLLIGSAQVLDSGRLPLPLGKDRPRRVVLQADDAHAERPAGTDPFAIRDIVDWLNPTLELRLDELRLAAAQRLDRWIPDWQGWQWQVDGGPPPWLVNRWESSRGLSSGFRWSVSTGDRPLTLTRRVDPEDRRRILRIVVARPPGDDVGSSEMEVFVDGQSRHRGEIPRRREGASDGEEVLVPLSADRLGATTIQVVQRPADASALVEWHTLEIADAESIREPPGPSRQPGPASVGRASEAQ
ncbi:MAG: NPCBM/NEW2 domain-containing protein, partial [Planctomycetes bacterium]|nr:NPCBM/NEW2 domain-containing protein [Planctomycetota bacterium]